MTDIVSHLDIEAEGAAMLVLAGVDMMFKARPRWTSDDLDKLRAAYPVSGSDGAAKVLPHKTIGAIHHKVRQLGLARPGQKKKAEPFCSTPHIDAAICRYYRGDAKRGGLSKLAHQVARPVKWVSVRALSLGVQVPRFDAGKWSDGEIELLRKNAAKIPITISRVLRSHGFKRSANAIALKLARLRCDRTDEDIYTASGLAELFCVDKSVITSWIRKGWLKARLRGSGHPNDAYEIHHNNVRRFVVENAGAVDIRRVDKHWFIDLLAGAG
jgi:hypothetical protein